LSSLFWCFWWCATTTCRRVWRVWALSRAAMGEIASLPVKFAGHQTCEGCHTDVLDAKSKGKHAHVNCEACHGALANHADDPRSSRFCRTRPCFVHDATQPAPPSRRDFRRWYHDHSGGVPCQTCHNPHSPAMDAGGANECFPASNADPIAGGGGCVESVLAGTPEDSPNYRMSDHWWGC